MERKDCDYLWIYYLLEIFECFAEFGFTFLKSAKSHDVINGLNFLFF